MTKGIEVLFKLINAITDKISKPASLLVFVIMCFTSFEVISRYVFNHPTVWVWPLNRQLFCLFILIAGVYTMSINEHIRIEIFYDLFPIWVKRTARIISILGLIIFLGVLVWQSAWMGWNALSIREVHSGSFRVPLYPIKLLIPIFSFLFMLQGIAVFYRIKNGRKKREKKQA